MSTTQGHKLNLLAVFLQCEHNPYSIHITQDFTISDLPPLLFTLASLISWRSLVNLGLCERCKQSPAVKIIWMRFEVKEVISRYRKHTRCCENLRLGLREF